MSSKQMERFALPAGRYDAFVTSVDLLEAADPKPWRLRVIARVERNGEHVSAFQQLAHNEQDPYAMNSSRRKSLETFAERLGVQSGGPAEEVVAAIRSLVDHRVTAHVRPSPFGMAVTLYAANGHASVDDRVLAGEVLDRVPAVEPDYRPETTNAQAAHSQLLAGLHHANRGLALAAEACWRLRREEGWVALGYDSIGHYLASPELAMRKSQFYALADIWEQYVQEGGQDEQRLCSPSKLEVPLAALKAGRVSAEEALADADSLGLRDLRAKYRPGKDKPEDDDDAGGGKSGRPEFPFACRACGVVIESEEDVVADGVVFHGHRWPAGWSHEQVVAAVGAAREAA